MALPKYAVEIRHPGLGKAQVITGTDPDIVELKAAAKRAEWDAQWERQQEIAREKADRERQRAAARQAKEDERAYREAQKQRAIYLTEQAEKDIEALHGLIAHTLKVDDRVNFDRLRNHDFFREPQPPKPVLTGIPVEPQPQFADTRPRPVPFFRKAIELAIPALKRRRLQAEKDLADAIRAADEKANRERHERWEAQCQEIKRADEEKKAAHAAQVKSWDERKAAYEAQRATTNARVDDLHKRYLASDTSAIEEYCGIVLSSSQYPDCFPKTFDLHYGPESRMAIVDYGLPRPEDLPKTKSVKYRQADDELDETPLTDGQLEKLYDGVVYQVALRTLHELFEADVVNALDAVVFNGIVRHLDPATGNEVAPCILSVQALKKDFEAIKLGAVDAKACVRKLKGVGSSQLHALAPVAPIVPLPRDDVRYIEGREVLDGIDEGHNLAAMDWEDFEHLIRELFEREFGQSGAEVRVTRASRDGGVDAVVLDPDPIRGGKYVIQSKRYTNTVGVAAVRDLYGTMINEGAVKGILVTTSTFGPDSYDFAKDKPITLLDGGNLLHMLQKHGTRAHIDLKAAKALTA